MHREVFFCCEQISSDGIYRHHSTHVEKRQELAFLTDTFLFRPSKSGEEFFEPLGKCRLSDDRWIQIFCYSMGVILLTDRQDSFRGRGRYYAGDADYTGFNFCIIV